MRAGRGRGGARERPSPLVRTLMLTLTSVDMPKNLYLKEAPFCKVRAVWVGLPPRVPSQGAKASSQRPRTTAGAR